MNKKILIADDHYVVRAGTALVLESAYPKLQIDFAENYEQVKKALDSDQYDLLLLDIDMPGTRYKKMITDLKTIQKDLKILIFSGYEKDIAVQYIREGAEGYLNKQSTEEEIKTAVKTILETGSYYPPELVSFFILQYQENDIAEKLSSREYEIFQLLADGHGNLEIANSLNLQMSTISTYKKRVFEKLNIKNIAELIKVYKNQH